MTPNGLRLWRNDEIGIFYFSIFSIDTYCIFFKQLPTMGQQEAQLEPTIARGQSHDPANFRYAPGLEVLSFLQVTHQKDKLPSVPPSQLSGSSHPRRSHDFD
jgi:hypothetical protein